LIQKRKLKIKEKRFKLTFSVEAINLEQIPLEEKEKQNEHQYPEGSFALPV
jgi:hypothetical protein